MDSTLHLSINLSSSLFKNAVILISNQRKIIYKLKDRYVNQHLIYDFSSIYIYDYLKVPPNVGVQKSTVVSCVTGNVLETGTKHKPRLLRSGSSGTSSSSGLS